MAINQHQEKPSIVNKTPQDIEELKRRLKHNSLNKEDVALLINCIDFSTWVPAALQEKDVSIANLRRALFGDSKKKRKKSKSGKDGSDAAGDNSDSSASTDATDVNDSLPEASADDQERNSNDDSVIDLDVKREEKKKGHGRLGASDYPNADEIFISISELQAGDFCPLPSCDGKVYELKKPSVVIRITGNTFAGVTSYQLQRFRCGTCTAIFKASLPEGVSTTEKYNANFKAQLAVQKYYVSVPFYRQEAYQRMLNFPLPNSTQFELCEDVADSAYPIIGALEKIAANGKLVHNDDTTAKVLSVIAGNEKHPDKKRTGMFTTGIVAKDHSGHQIMLYYTGTQHAGENLDDILQQRITQKEKIRQMCDALSANIPVRLKTIVGNCLSHSFRKFRDLLDFYPEPCLHVITALSKVYENDEKTHDMSDIDRLKYHRKHSKAIMLDLQGWLKAQIREKLVEPNSPLGKAIKYMLRHWKKLRRFLTTPGMPIDNNIVERALKIPIRIRKSAMFYKTLHGATISNILLSLIMTAQACGENPVEYLAAIQDNKSAVFEDPGAWIPWRYQETLKVLVLKKAA